MINFEIFVRTQRIMLVEQILYGEGTLGWKLFSSRDQKYCVYK